MAKVAKIWDGTDWVEFISAIPNPYPDQNGNANKYLTTDGTFPYWADVVAQDGTNSFATINTPSGTDPVADSSSDTLNITASNGMVVTGDSSTDTVNFSTNATSLNTESTIVSRDSNQSFDITAIDFDTSDTISSAVGRLTWDDGEGTLNFGLKGGNLNLRVGQENTALCYNGTGSTITKGSVVYISGAQGQRPSISLADADSESTSSKTFGVAAENISNGAEGFVCTFGIVENINTSTFTAGQALWLSSTAGQLTNTKPTPPVHSVFVGYCLKSNSSSGRIFITPQNGYELDELHNVLINGVADNHIISYDNATSLWKNQALIDAIKEVDGTGSGIDSDLLDGHEATYFLNTSSSAQTKAGDLTITGNLTVNGTTTTINSTVVTVDDKNIELGAIDSPTDSTADGGGIILKGDTDKTVLWSNSISSWTFSDSINLTSGSVIKIAGTPVLSVTNYTGNAATVTNGVYTDQSYSNPTWIASLAWTKITSTPTSISGYGITDAVSTLGSYSNPSWLTDVAWSKITSTPTSLSGYGITDLGIITSGTWNASVIDEAYIDTDIARLNAPTFIGTVVLPNTTSIGDVSATELAYLNGVTSAIQTQLDGKLASSVASTTYAPLNSPTFTGTVILPSATSIGDISSTEISYLDGVTSAIQTQLNNKAPLESPTFTGTVSGITKSMVGLGNVDNTSDSNKPVSTAQQTALDLKANLSGATFSGFVTLHADPTQAMHAATKKYVDETAEGLQTKPAVEIATTANLSATYSNGTDGVGATLTATSNGAFPTIDGVTLSSTTPGQNGVLVKNQSTSAQNGRYNLTQVGDSNNPWVLTRCGLCDEADEIPGAYIFVKRGTLNAGSGWVLIVSNPTTFTVGTDNITVFQFSGAGTITAGTNISVTGTQVSTVNDPTFSGLVTASSGVAFSDGTQTKVGVPSISSFISKTSSYTLDTLTLRDNIIEMDSTSATTVTIPTDATLNYPIGASIDVFQINTGEVTIAGAVGVTVNATPGLKLRTRWSSCTLLKRGSNSWIVYGDLKA